MMAERHRGTLLFTVCVLTYEASPSSLTEASHSLQLPVVPVQASGEVEESLRLLQHAQPVEEPSQHLHPSHALQCLCLVPETMKSFSPPPFLPS